MRICWGWERDDGEGKALGIFKREMNWTGLNDSNIIC